MIDNPQRISFRDVLGEKVNQETLALHRLLSEHTDEPTALLKEVLAEIGGETLYLPVVESVERAEAWFRLRAGENMVEVAEDMEELTDPLKVRQIAHRPLDEL